MKKFILILSISFIVNMGLYSQKSPEKFGKNIEDHLTSEVCNIDSSAGAYVIFDFGVVDYDYTEIDGFIWTQKRHLRIKFLNKNEFDKASFSIPIYNHYRGEEKVFDLKGVSYNLKNGKIIESKIGKRDGITEERSENWNLFKFTLPNVEEGSIIEISYKLRSPYISYLRDWNFQWDIPVLHSEIYLRIPEYFDYHQNMKGYYSLTNSETISESGTLSFTNKKNVASEENYQSSSLAKTNVIKYQIYTKHFISNNIPALKAEDYVDNMENYRSGIQFELSKSKFGMDSKSYATNWEAVTNRLLEATYFGQKLNKLGFAKKHLDGLIELHPNKTDQMNAIYTFVQQKIKWNGKTGFNDDMTLREVYNKESGRAADINFILVNMLKEAGFNALPVALSTRKNGIILPAFPTMEEFNNMIVLVILDEKKILLDASSSYCSPGVLPLRCLNGKGRVIDREFNSWVDLEPKGKFDEMKMYDMKIDEKGGFSGNMMFRNKAYASIDFREQLEDVISLDKMIEDMEESFPGMSVESSEIKGLEDQYGPIQGKLEIKITDQSDYMGDMIIFNPLIYEKISANPFKLEDRKYPVNYTYFRDYKYIYKYEVPEGFEIESLPSPLKLATPDNSLRFLYSASMLGNVINISVMLKINKITFIQDEYIQLKEFYNQLITKESEQIILKKISNP